MKIIKRMAVLLGFVLLGVTGAHAQSQLLLPYNDMIFQSTWENPAVRPMHRFSVGLPVISSVEFGLINNGFRLKSVSQVREGRMYINLGKIYESVEKYKHGQQFSEVSFDVFHFRMAWRDWFFWAGMRNTTTETFLYDKDLIGLIYKGNKQFMGTKGDFSATGVEIQNYNELTLGFSKIMDKWTFGVRASFLTGLAALHTDINEFSLAVEGEEGRLFHHTLAVDGGVSTSCFPRDERGIPTTEPLKDLKYWKERSWFNFKNPGAALAGAVSYRPIKGLTLTLAFSDLGFIDWTDSVGTYKLKKDEGEFDRVVNGIRDKVFNDGELTYNSFNDFLEIDTASAQNGTRFTTWLSPKFHLMGTYEFARGSIVGASFSGIVHQKQFYPSATVSFQQYIGTILGLQASWSYNQRSALNFGAGLIFNPGPVQFYIVTDNFLAAINPKLVKATNVRVGINLVFGPLHPANKLTHR